MFCPSQTLGTHGWCLFSGRVFVNVQPDAAGVQQGVATLQSAASQQQKKCEVFKPFQMPEYQSEMESVSSNCLTVPASSGQAGLYWTNWSLLVRQAPTGKQIKLD